MLTRDPGTNKYLINFDPYIYEVIREAEWMTRLGLEVPEFIKIITFCKEKIFTSCETIKKLVEENNNVRRSVPLLFLNLINEAFLKLEATFQPCLSIVTWTSLKIPQICEEIHKVLQEVKIFIKKIKDSKEARVDEIFEIIAGTNLINLSAHAISPTQFSTENHSFGIAIGAQLDIQSSAVENAVIAIINKCLRLINDPEVESEKFYWLDPDKLNRQIGTQQANVAENSFEPGFRVIEDQVNLIKIHNDCMDVYAYFHNKLIHALFECTKNSINTLKKRINSRGKEPLLLAHFVLQIPNIVLTPSIEELDTHVNTVLTNSIGVHKGIIIWGQRYDRIKKKKSPEGQSTDGKFNYDVDLN